jgi:N-acetylated-alpha-linked acidic dipeptidase
MAGEKHPYEHLPIPSYEEATSSRPPSSQAVNDDPEREGLLPQDASESNQPSRTAPRPALFSRWGDQSRGNYRPPTAQSVADSDDGLSLPSIDSDDTEDGDAALRQDIEQMEMLEPGSLDGVSRSSARSLLSKRLSSLTTTLSSLHLPTFHFPRPSFTWLTSRMPTWPQQYRPGCAIMARLTGLFVVISLLYAFFVMEILPSGRGLGQPNPEWARTFAQGSIDRGRIRENLRKISGYDHVAGSEGDYSLAMHIEEIFRDIGLDVARKLE